MLAGVGAVAALGVGWATFSSLRSRPVSEELATASSPWGSPREHVQLQRDMASVPIADWAGVRSQFIDAIGSDVADPKEVVSAEAEASLIETLSLYIQAWSAPSTDAYMKIVSDEDTSWLDPDDRTWARIEHALQTRHGVAADRSVPGEAMRLLVDDWMLGNGHRWTEIGQGDRGVRVLFDRTSSESGLRTVLLAERAGVKEYSFTTGGGAHSLRMREPARSPARILREQDFLDYAQVVVRVGTEGGKVGYWHSTWYYDPMNKRWLNDRSTMESFHGLAMLY